MSSSFKRATDYVFSKKFVKYIFSTHFWGPVSNFGIPLSAIASLKDDPEKISGPMTASLVVYSAVFMRYATQVRPPNPLLFVCHLANEAAQLGQGYRFIDYHYLHHNDYSKYQQKTTASPGDTDKTA